MVLRGVVLAAGRSRRMGVDKALLTVRGEPLWERQIRTLLEAGSLQPLLSVRPEQAWVPAGFPAVLDDRPDAGPLAGILAALRAVTPPPRPSPASNPPTAGGFSCGWLPPGSPPPGPTPSASHPSYKSYPSHPSHPSYPSHKPHPSSESPLLKPPPPDQKSPPVSTSIAEPRVTHLAVLAVDLPEMPAAWFLELWAHCRDGVGAVGRQEQFWEPLAAIYPVTALAAAERALEARQMALQPLIAQGVREGWLTSVPIAAAYAAGFTNWNDASVRVPSAGGAGE